MAELKIGLVHGDPAALNVPFLAVAVGDDEVDKGRLKSAALKALDAALDGALASAAAEAEYDGKSGSDLSLHTHGKLRATRLVLLGLGRSKHDRDAARLTACRAVRAAERAKAKAAALVFPFAKDELLVEAAAEGAQLGAYRFDKYLSDRKDRRLARLDLVLEGAATKAQKAAAELGRHVGESVNLARDLVNEPGKVITPAALAAAARAIAKDGGLRVEVLDRRAIERLNMGMFLGVAQGSAEPPQLIHLWWDPAAGGAKGKAAAKAKGDSKAVAFVGKAITFDSGGLSIKTAQGMETMKTDMAGSAAVLGAMRAVALLKPPFAVHAYVGACENMPSGTAQRPGDIVRARNGKTVEILNTDAEGRLVLGDVLSWAVEPQPSLVVDVATLTGAITVALGPSTTGLFASSDEVADEILAAAKQAGEDLWRMPLLDHLKELIKSPVADLKNIGGPKGGSITAALFLREFVGAVPWAHLDIAGPSHLDKERGVDPRGGTGHGVRTLVELVRARMGR